MSFFLSYSSYLSCQSFCIFVSSACHWPTVLSIWRCASCASGSLSMIAAELIHPILAWPFEAWKVAPASRRERRRIVVFILVTLCVCYSLPCRAALELVDHEIRVVIFRFAVEQNEDLFVAVEHEVKFLILRNALDHLHYFLLDRAEERVGRERKLAVVAELFLAELHPFVLKLKEVVPLRALLDVVQEAFLLLEFLILRLEVLIHLLELALPLFPHLVEGFLGLHGFGEFLEHLRGVDVADLQPLGARSAARQAEEK